MTQLNKTQRVLIERARERHGCIYPVGESHSFSECFTNETGFEVLWYDTGDKSTHLIHAKTEEVIPEPVEYGESPLTEYLSLCSNLGQ